jgi:hypothetical protein
MKQSRITAAAMIAAVLGAGYLAFQSPARAKGGDVVHPSGILVVAAASPSFLPAETPPELAQAWSDAYDLALANPDDFGYPQVTTAGKAPQVELRVVTNRGAALAAQRSLGAVARAPFSFAQLEAIKDKAIGADEAGLPSASAIWAALPNPATNRVRLLVDEAYDDLLYALAEEYDPRAIEVQVQPRVVMRPMVGRQDDNNPYYGGSKRSTTDKSNGTRLTCSDAFGWGWSGTYALLTAGHCARNGAWVYEPDGPFMGDVHDWVEENWSNGGTHGFNGSTTMRGDLALVRLTSGKYSSPYIYRGGSTSSSGQRVNGRTGWSGIGNGFCVGGQRSGEICGFRVIWTGINFDYFNDGIIRNAVWGRRVGTACPNAGDSGGPVYEVRGDGTLWAKGVFSGSTGDVNPLVCDLLYTDINHAYFGLPGDVLH